MYPQQQDWAVQGGPQGPGWGTPAPTAWGQAPQGPPPGWGTPPQQAPQPTAPTAAEPPSMDDFLTARHPGAKFEQVGQVIGGEITSAPRTKQQTDPATGSLKFYPRSGDPMWQLLVPVRAQDPDGDDDGIRTLYVKNQMRDAVAAAVAKAGAARLEVGGMLQVRFVREEPNPKGGFAKKVYEARYIPPAAGGRVSPEAQASATQGIRDTDVSARPQAAAVDDEPPF